MICRHSTSIPNCRGRQWIEPCTSPYHFANILQCHQAIANGAFSLAILYSQPDSLRWQTFFFSIHTKSAAMSFVLERNACTISMCESSTNVLLNINMINFILKWWMAHFQQSFLCHQHKNIITVVHMQRETKNPLTQMEFEPVINILYRSCIFMHKKLDCVYFHTVNM